MANAIAKAQAPTATESKAVIEFDTAGFGLKTMNDAFRFGECVVQSAMFPQVKTPQQAIILLQIARDTRIPFTTAAQNICFINGRASLFGDGLLSAAYAGGQMEDIREEFEGAGDTLTAICSVKRRGIPSPVVRSFSIADAKRAGLSGGKSDAWAKYPQRMCQMRARAWALRDAGLTQGIASAEEQRDIIDVEAEALPSAVKQPRALADKIASASAELKTPKSAPVAPAHTVIRDSPEAQPEGDDALWDQVERERNG